MSASVRHPVFAHYPETVTEVVAVEPEPHLREKAVTASGGGCRAKARRVRAVSAGSGVGAAGFVVAAAMNWYMPPVQPGSDTVALWASGGTSAGIPRAARLHLLGVPVTGVG